MQDNEVLILEEIEKNPNTTQRDLSEKNRAIFRNGELTSKKVCQKRVCQIRKT